MASNSFKKIPHSTIIEAFERGERPVAIAKRLNYGIKHVNSIIKKAQAREQRQNVA